MWREGERGQAKPGLAQYLLFTRDLSEPGPLSAAGLSRNAGDTTAVIAADRPLPAGQGRGGPRRQAGAGTAAARRRHLVGKGVRLAGNGRRPSAPAAEPGRCPGARWRRAGDPRPRRLCFSSRCGRAAWGGALCPLARMDGAWPAVPSAEWLCLAPLQPQARPGRCSAGRCQPERAKSHSRLSPARPGLPHGLYEEPVKGSRREHGGDEAQPRSISPCERSRRVTVI